MKKTFEQLLKSAKRELAMRRSAYPKWKKDGRKLNFNPDHEIECMGSIVSLLEELSGLNKQKSFSLSFSEEDQQAFMETDHSGLWVAPVAIFPLPKDWQPGSLTIRAQFDGSQMTGYEIVHMGGASGVML